LDLISATPACVLRDHRHALRVIDAIDQSVRGEATEDDGVHGPDARAGQQRNRKLRGHAHIYSDAIAGLDAKLLQRIRALRHFAKKLLIRERAYFARLSFPNNGGFVLTGPVYVPIKAVVGEIDLAADEPLRPGQIPLENRVPFLEPMQFACHRSPKLLRVSRSRVVDFVVLRHALDLSMLSKVRGRIELSILAKDRLNVLLMHGCVGLRHGSPEGKWSFRAHRFYKVQGPHFQSAKRSHERQRRHVGNGRMASSESRMLQTITLRAAAKSGCPAPTGGGSVMPSPIASRAILRVSRREEVPSTRARSTPVLRRRSS